MSLRSTPRHRFPHRRRPVRLRPVRPPQRVRRCRAPDRLRRKVCRARRVHRALRTRRASPRAHPPASARGCARGTPGRACRDARHDEPRTPSYRALASARREGRRSTRDLSANTDANVLDHVVLIVVPVKPQMKEIAYACNQAAPTVVSRAKRAAESTETQVTRCCSKRTRHCDWDSVGPSPRNLVLKR